MRTREYEWYRNQVRYPRQVRDVVIRIGIVMAMVIMLFGWVVPAGSDNDNWEKFQDFIGSDPLKELSDLWNRLFSSLEGEGIATADYYGGERLDLSGPIQLGDDPVMRVDLQGDFTPNRLYWRSTAFDTYINGSWTHRREVRAFKDSSGMTFAIGNFEARRNLVQEFTMDIAASSLVYAAPQPVELGLPVEAELNCVDGGGSSCVNDGKQTDVAVIRARETLRKGDQYEVTSSVSTATADQLRQTGSDYPEWVTYSYLQGGDDISFNLRGLTQQIIQFNAAQSNYDKAKSIEQWLRTNIAYNELIPAPPSDRDPLDWFIFDIREGYCNYYATAMVMMLRSEGIPARMAAGFAEGDYDPNTGIYTVIERDAHTWVEVYFPGYGWIEFEPTSDEEQLERAGDNVFSDDFPTLTPIPSPTPTILPTNTPPPVAPTPTATLTPTATPQGTPPSQQTETPQPTSTPTITPSPTITPTSTQGPEQQTPITDVEADDDGGNFWQTVLLILMIILIPLAILTLIGLFMIWWVEYRGLGGLTPIQRAYARMGIYGRWLGADINTLLTPDEQRRRLVEEVPDGREPINTITGLYTEERFAPPRRDDGLASRGENRAKRSWTLARKAFIAEKINRWLGRV